MDYASIYPNIYIRTYASDMVLRVVSDTAYLVAPKARICIALFYYVSDYPTYTTHPCLDGAILVEYKTLRHVVSSAIEAEVVGIFNNTQVSVPIRRILEVLNHPLPPTSF